MLEIRCDDCAAVIPSERVEHDETVRTLFHVTKHKDEYRVLSISIGDHPVPPVHPYVGGKDRDLCVECLIMALQSPPLGGTAGFQYVEPKPTD